MADEAVEAAAAESAAGTHAEPETSGAPATAPPSATESAQQFRTPALIVIPNTVRDDVAVQALAYNEAERALSFLDPGNPAHAMAIVEKTKLRDEAHRMFNVLGGASASSGVPVKQEGVEPRVHPLLKQLLKG